jgi:RIO-like serine/threonine protein kinase
MTRSSTEHSLSLTRSFSQVFNTLMELIVRLAAHGLVHCDFNEFNLLITEVSAHMYIYMCVCVRVCVRACGCVGVGV